MVRGPGMVGDPGIEPGMSLLGGVTVRCRTLQHVAHWRGEYARRQGASRTKIPGRGACSRARAGAFSRPFGTEIATMKKPAWVIDKERARRAAAAETVWLFGLHAVRDALMNPRREKLRLVLTKNAADRLGRSEERRVGKGGGSRGSAQ